MSDMLSHDDSYKIVLHVVIYQLFHTSGPCDFIKTILNNFNFPAPFWALAVCIGTIIVCFSVGACCM